jgi:hypothetical protein
MNKKLVVRLCFGLCAIVGLVCLVHEESQKPNVKSLMRKLTHVGNDRPMSPSLPTDPGNHAYFK